ncbi:MAG: substrate-binding domain-containing protein [Eubacteriales bacterium]|nr:substrate-binding domain-containing protein [Eubacteriales bacterium]
MESGIPVVTVLNDSTGSLRQCFVGNNNYNLGQDYGRQIVELLGEDADGGSVLVLVDEDRTDTSQNLILLGIRETLTQELPDCPVTVDTALVDNTGAFSSEESIRDILLNEQLPDIIVCLDEIHTRCAYQAAVDYNQVGTVRILGYYDSASILEAVSKEILSATITPDTEQMGRYCVQALEEYADTGYTNGYMAVDTYLITKAEALRMLEQE